MRHRMSGRKLNRTSSHRKALFGNMAAALDDRSITPLKAETEYVPTTLSELTEDQETEVLALIDRLEQDDDVTRVFHTLP